VESWYVQVAALSLFFIESSGFRLSYYHLTALATSQVYFSRRFMTAILRNTQDTAPPHRQVEEPRRFRPGAA
jgi:hypothetical protein